jgi:hypothetical protein
MASTYPLEIVQAERWLTEARFCIAQIKCWAFARLLAMIRPL